MVEECSSVENFLYNNHCCINPENFDSVLFNRKMWMDDHQRLINELRSAINTHLPDEDLHVLVDGVMLNYSDLYRLKGLGVKSDVFHMLSGMWKTPAERFFMWLGGFRTSELLKILVSHLEPVTDQQLIGFCNLQLSSQQAEDALSQGMEALQQSLVETLSSTCLGCLGPSGSGNVADYMGQMAISMSKLATLENFVHQAEGLVTAQQELGQTMGELGLMFMKLVKFENQEAVWSLKEGEPLT